MELNQNIPPVVQTILNLPLIEFLVGAVVLFWIIFSLIYIYHWVHYGRNILVSMVVIGIYLLTSLALIGFIVIQLLYV